MTASEQPVNSYIPAAHFHESSLLPSKNSSLALKNARIHAKGGMKEAVSA